LIYPRANEPSDFTYPEDRLYRARGILSTEEIRKPNRKNHKDDSVRFVIKRGLTSLTTVGGLSGYEAHTRQYFGLSSFDSVELAICPYDNHSGPFSKGGDSGSIIIDASGKFAGLLTSGMGETDSSDITFATPMHWLWGVIRAKFPGASLNFDDDN
jgi:hypothetical protein